MLRLVDWANKVQHKHVSDFFDTLVHLFRELFQARMVTIWDYTPDNESLVLQASTPERTSHRASYVIPVKRSMTGRILDTEQIETQDITVSADGRTFSNPELAAQLGLKTMYSVPIFKPGSRLVRLILNLCYGADESLPLPKDELQFLSDFVAICFEHRLYKRAVHIREEVAKVAAMAAGIRSLFESIEDRIKGRTHAEIAQILRVRGGVLVEEGRSATPDGAKKLRPVEIAAIHECCVRNGQVYMERIAEGDRFDCRLLAIPFLSAADKAIAVLCCKEPVAADGRVRAFSSIDLHALQTFVEMLAPSVERFSRLEHGRSLAIIRRVSRALEGVDGFDLRLHRTLQELCGALDCEIASIFLRTRDKPDEFLMRAAHGPNESLVGEARYRVGEGLTGSVAESGSIVNLRDDAELNVHPWTGKYDGPIWGSDAREHLRAFLAVPIQSENSTVGVLKLANIRASSTHADSFFTDEDVQLVRVLASFLAHAVRNDEVDQERLLQFRLLAQASLDMQSTTNEEESVTVLLSTLEKSSVPGARVILKSGDQTAKPFELGFGILDSAHPPALAEWEAQARLATSPGYNRVDFQEKGVRYRCYEFPIQVGESTTGVLQVVPPSSAADPNNDVLILRAFTGQFEAAVGRVRTSRRAQELADEAVTRHRFVAAETVYLAAVHRLGHTLDSVLTNLEAKLKDTQVRENRVALEETTALKKTIEQLKNELKSSLNIVRANEETTYDVHPAISVAVRRWNSDRGRRCKAISSLQASNATCRLNPDAIQEIVNILLVNSEQAHAREVTLTTRNDSRIEIERSDGEPLYIHSAFCLELQDDGPGVPPESLEEIFLPVYTSKPKRFGTGLGLFIARMLARRGGGELKAHKPRNSKGALFRLTLPTFEVNQ